jgi:thiol-disulfide isomerase/thioredoxin
MRATPSSFRCSAWLVRFAGLASAAGLAGSPACGRDEAAKPDPVPATAVAATPKPVDLLPAPTGDVKEIVQRELGRAKDEGRKLLVYVGATWCEPCQRFHEAARAGKVDALFPGLRLLEFDLDKDRDRLEAAGYKSRMIPLFALPRADGVASGEQIEGSIKGPGAVDQIAPRLSALLGR